MKLKSQIKEKSGGDGNFKGGNMDVIVILAILFVLITIALKEEE